MLSSLLAVSAQTTLNITSSGDADAAGEDGSGASDDAEWWAGVAVTGADLNAVMPLDASEGGLWAGCFVPPPPRPSFLRMDAGASRIATDGITTCDLCTWAWQDRPGAQQNGATLFSLDGILESPGEIGWALTLVIVSLISAVVGAVIMVTILHWRRLKNSGTRGMCSICVCGSNPNPVSNEANRIRNRAPAPIPPGTERINITEKDNVSSPAAFNRVTSSNNGTSPAAPPSGVWSWFRGRISAPPVQLMTTAPTSAAENHYTHMDDAYTAVDEALYAELDRDSNSPAYQNTAYNGSELELDAPVSSAPSSAYYSDLSVTTVSERAYEVVGSKQQQQWEGVVNNEVASRRFQQPPPVIKLAAINETISVQPSDYV